MCCEMLSRINDILTSLLDPTTLDWLSWFDEQALNVTLYREEANRISFTLQKLKK